MSNDNIIELPINKETKSKDPNAKPGEVIEIEFPDFSEPAKAERLSIVLHQYEEMMMALLGHIMGINIVLDKMRAGKTVIDIFEEWARYNKGKY